MTAEQIAAQLQVMVRVNVTLAEFLYLPGAHIGECPDCGSPQCVYASDGFSAFCPACAWGAS